MSEKIKVASFEGDGIGPEIMTAVREILKAAGVMDCIEFIDIEVGEKVYLEGHSSGIRPSAWEQLKDVTTLLKAPITTPSGKGVKSLNVTIRKKLGLYANIRPAVSYYPVIKNSPPVMDLIIVRENEEDLYAGIEHRGTHEAFTSLKLLTKHGSLKICHYAFEYARVNGRKKVTCMIKDNIMKMTDGMFYEAFLEVAKHYPKIEAERYIIDIGAARLASKPQVFDVVVTENLYGDIVSDITSEIAGSVGIAGSSNIGERYAMFEAIHGSAPLMAGKNTANPTAFINATILMLMHIGIVDKAVMIKNALLKTLEDGMHTKDLYKEGESCEKLGTKEFAQEVIKRLGQKPLVLKAEEVPKCSVDSIAAFNESKYSAFLSDEPKKLVGVDLFIDLLTDDASKLAEKILKSMSSNCDITLASIMCRGLSVWPEVSDIKLQTTINGHSNKYDHWMCRFMGNESSVISHDIVNKLMIDLTEEGFDIIKMEKLYKFGNVNGFSAGQGE